MKKYILRFAAGYCTLFFAVLCFWQGKEIRFLTDRRRTEYRILAEAELDRAILSYEAGAALPEVYHALRTAAEYYAMTTDGDCQSIGASVTDIGTRYLESGALPDMDRLWLRKLAAGETEAQKPSPNGNTGSDAGSRTVTESVRRCRERAEEIVGVRGICRQVWVERGGDVVLFYFDNGYIRLRLRDALPIEWAFSYPTVKKATLTAAECRQKAARCIPQITVTIRDVRAAEEGYWMHFSGKMGNGRLFIRESDGRVTTFLTDPVGA